MVHSGKRNVGVETIRAAFSTDESRARAVDHHALDKDTAAESANADSQPQPSRLRRFLVSLLTVILTAAIGTVIGLYLAGVHSIGIFIPILLYLSAAVIAWPIGWSLGALFRKGKTTGNVFAYVLGFAWVAVSGYLSTIDRLVTDYRDQIKIERPAITESEWRALRESAERQAAPIATQKAGELVIIVLGWACLYWCIKMPMGKFARRPSSAQLPRESETGGAGSDQEEG